MRHPAFLRIFLIVLISFDGFLTSGNKKRRSNKESEAENAIMASEVYETEVKEVENEDLPPTSLKKRSFGTVHMSDVKPVGILKGTTQRPPHRVNFDQSIIDETTYDPSDPSAEQKYLDALNGRRFDLVFDLRKQGLILSNSDFVYKSVNKILKMSPLRKKMIDVLFKNQPQVFTQGYKCRRNVFQDASQETIDYFITRYGGNIRGILSIIFIEAARNSELILTESFFEKINVTTMWKMIEYAEKHAGIDLIQNCYILPPTLDGINEKGETLFTEAVNNFNFERIEGFLQRKDVADFILSQNSQKLNPIDMAVKLFDEGRDRSYMVLRRLMPVITNIYKAGSIMNLRMVIKEFIDNCREADDNQIILDSLEEEFKSAIEYANENDVNGFGPEFISILDEYLDKIYVMKLDNISSSSESESDSSNENESVRSNLSDTSSEKFDKRSETEAV